MPTFKVQGQVYHRIGSMLLLLGEEPQFLQIYFIGDALVEAERRRCAVAGLKLDIILPIQEMLHRTNSYVTSFKTARTPHHYPPRQSSGLLVNIQGSSMHQKQMRLLFSLLAKTSTNET